PFIVVMNNIPRIALIPIFVLIAKPTMNAEILAIVAIVFFLAFFNAFEGGRSVSPSMLASASLLGAGPVGLMRTIRLPMVLTWTFAIVPNALSFGLLAAVATEVLAGLPGMGTLLQNAMANIDSALTFAVVVVLCVVGLIFYGAAQLLRRAVIRW